MRNLVQFAVYTPPVHFPSKQCVIMLPTLDVLPYLYLPGVAVVTPKVPTATFCSNDATRFHLWSGTLLCPVIPTCVRVRVCV